MISRRAFTSSAITLPFFSLAARAEVVVAGSGDQTKAIQTAIVAAAKSGGAVQLGAGTFEVSVLTIKKNVTIQGVPGVTKLVAQQGGKIFSIRQSDHVVLQGLGLSAKGNTGNIVTAEGIERLIIQDCDFSGGEAAIRVASCGGRITGNRFQLHAKVAIQSIDSKGIMISGNRVQDIGNCGIQVMQTEPREDGSVISDNFVSRIAATEGGNGQNGLGISIVKAGSVVVANNRISDCAFSGIRNNAGANSIIQANSISRCNEIALVVEFNHSGSVVADNIIDTAAQGIEIVNFDAGGRLSQCTGNICRNLTNDYPQGQPLGGGILCDADVVVANNLVDVAKNYGICLGWATYGRSLQASNNTLIGCRRGIEFSLAGEGPYSITNNIISGATVGAIVGMDRLQPITTDLAAAGAKLPPNVNISGNMVKM